MNPLTGEWQEKQQAMVAEQSDELLMQMLSKEFEISEETAASIVVSYLQVNQ